MYEMIESISIVNQTIKKCATWGVSKDDKLLDGYDILSYISEQEVEKKIYNHNVTMENTIDDFKY